MMRLEEDTLELDQKASEYIVLKRFLAKFWIPHEDRHKGFGSYLIVILCTDEVKESP